MKKYTHIPVTIVILLSSVTLASAMSPLPRPTTSLTPQYEQELSRSERLDIYNKFQAMGHDAFALASFIDPTTSSTTQFNDVVTRLKRVIELKQMGYPVLGFTNDVITD
jgi:hypothetical protein